jgi:hypothetical protein
MEKLITNRNGQWKLIKVWGDPDYDNISHGNTPFSDQESENAARQAFMQYVQHNAPSHVQVKNMPNLTTNIVEPHVLMHRGIGEDEESDINPHGYFVNAEGIKSYSNRLDFSDGSTVKTKTNSINTLHPEEAEGHAKDSTFGKKISFWVPASSIYGHCTAINHHILNPERPLQEYTTDPDFDQEHVMIKPGQYPLANDIVHYRDYEPIPKHEVK